MLLNELAQWAVLAFLMVFVFGLTRQLGFFLVPRREQLAEGGPKIGEAIPDYLFEETPRRSLMRLIESGAAGTAAIFVIDEDCAACNAIVGKLQEREMDVGMPTVGLIKGQAHDQFRRRAGEAFQQVIEDETGERSERAGIQGTPFLMIVDGQLVVRHKDWGGGVADSAVRWSEDARQNGSLAVVHSQQMSQRGG